MLHHLKLFRAKSRALTHNSLRTRASGLLRTGTRVPHSAFREQEQRLLAPGCLGHSHELAQSTPEGKTRPLRALGRAGLEGWSQATRELESGRSHGGLLGLIVGGPASSPVVGRCPRQQISPFPTSESPAPGIWLLPLWPVHAPASRRRQDGARTGSARGLGAAHAGGGA